MTITEVSEQFNISPDTLRYKGEKVETAQNEVSEWLRELEIIE